MEEGVWQHIHAASHHMLAAQS